VQAPLNGSLPPGSIQGLCWVAPASSSTSNACADQAHDRFPFMVATTAAATQKQEQEEEEEEEEDEEEQQQQLGGLSPALLLMLGRRGRRILLVMALVLLLLLCVGVFLDKGETCPKDSSQPTNQSTKHVSTRLDTSRCRVHSSIFLTIFNLLRG